MSARTLLAAAGALLAILSAPRRGRPYRARVHLAPRRRRRAQHHQGRDRDLRGAIRSGTLVVVNSNGKVVSVGQGGVAPEPRPPQGQPQDDAAGRALHRPLDGRGRRPGSPARLVVVPRPPAAVVIAGRTAAPAMLALLALAPAASAHVTVAPSQVAPDRSSSSPSACPTSGTSRRRRSRCRSRPGSRSSPSRSSRAGPAGRPGGRRHPPVGELDGDAVGGSYVGFDLLASTPTSPAS